MHVKMRRCKNTEMSSLFSVHQEQKVTFSFSDLWGCVFFFHKMIEYDFILSLADKTPFLYA